MDDGRDDQRDDAALLSALLEAAVDAIIVADGHGTILKANPAACNMFQHHATEMVGQSVNFLMPPAIAHEHDGYMKHYIETGERRIIGIGRDVEGQRKDGTIFPLHLSVGHTEIEGRRMFIGILHDLTERRAAQTALSRSQRLDAVGQMTGGIAHDFNNLLTVIIGNLELLQMRTADDSAEALVKDALDAAELGADLTSRLTLFARKGDLKPVRSDLKVLCEDMLAILKRTLGARIAIATELAADSHPVMVDPAQLQSALMNLALNARDAMGGVGEILISVENVSIDDNYIAQEIDVEPGEYVRLSVSDNGEGMSEEAQRRAFEPFFTTKADAEGNGLGLAMVYGFVRQSGGHITLYSEPGLGTSFSLYFPALRQPNEAATATPADSVAAHPQIGRGKTVLVVEDNPKVRRLSASRIRDLGFAVEEATSGDAAYAMLQAGTHADIVFSDLVMPGDVNGYDLAAKIAAEFPQVRVLLTSGYASDVVQAELAQERNHNVLHKPYRQTDLILRLQALLAEGGG